MWTWRYDVRRIQATHDVFSKLHCALLASSGSDSGGSYETTQAMLMAARWRRRRLSKPTSQAALLWCQPSGLLDKHLGDLCCHWCWLWSGGCGHERSIPRWSKEFQTTRTHRSWLSASSGQGIEGLYQWECCDVGHQCLNQSRMMKVRGGHIVQRWRPNHKTLHHCGSNVVPSRPYPRHWQCPIQLFSSS